MREQGRGTSEDLQIPEPPQQTMRADQGWRPAPRRAEALMMTMLIGATIVILLAGAGLMLVFLAATSTGRR